MEQGIVGSLIYWGRHKLAFAVTRAQNLRQCGSKNVARNDAVEGYG